MITGKINNQKKIQQQKQQKRVKALIWITGVLVVALIALVILSKPSAPNSISEFSYDKLPMLGNPNAPVKIVELADFKCPTCQHFNQNVKPQLMKDYIEKGIVSFYFLNYPIIATDSFTAAQAAQAVYHQNKDAYWKFVDAVYLNQGDESVEWATPAFLTDIARKNEIQVDYDKLQQDIESKAYLDEVHQQYATAEKTGARGTPTLFINGKMYENLFEYDALKAVIESAKKGEQQK